MRFSSLGDACVPAGNTRFTGLIDGLAHSFRICSEPLANENFFSVVADSATATAVATAVVVVVMEVVLEAAAVTEWATSALACRSKIGVCLSSVFSPYFGSVPSFSLASFFTNSGQCRSLHPSQVRKGLLQGGSRCQLPLPCRSRRVPSQTSDDHRWS